MHDFLNHRKYKYFYRFIDLRLAQVMMFNRRVVVYRTKYVIVSVYFPNVFLVDRNSNTYCDYDFSDNDVPLGSANMSPSSRRMGEPLHCLVLFQLRQFPVQDIRRSGEHHNILLWRLGDSLAIGP